MKAKVYEPDDMRPSRGGRTPTKKGKSLLPTLKLVGLGAIVAIAVWQLVLPSMRRRHGVGETEHRSMLHLETSGSIAGGAGTCDSNACVAVDLGQLIRGSDVMYGMFFEDINHAGEGGLLVEMVRDWSFEARAHLIAHPELQEETVKDLERKPWPTDAPILVRGAGGLPAESMDPNGVASLPLADALSWQLSGSGIKEELVIVNATHGLHALCVDSTSVTVTWLTNKGHTLRGFAVEGLVAYRLRLKVKGKSTLSVQASFGSEDGGIMYTDTTIALSSGTPDETDPEWTVLDGSLVPPHSNKATYLHLTWRGPGQLCFDWVSLTPRTSWSAAGTGNILDPLHPRLVAAMTALNPQFLRFPGGAFVEGTTIATAYRWKTTIGPRELRPGHPNSPWGYWSSDGLGIFEFLQLSEKLGAEPVYVMQVGISQTESVLPDELPVWIQDGLDALEFILGPSNTTWGQKRISMGRAKPWSLTYVTLGNEECRRPWYAQHYVRFANAILAQYPTLKLLCNCDLGHAGSSAPAPYAWEFHSYKAPGATFALRRLVHEYQGPKVAVSEFAALSDDVVANAIAEAGFMAALERNCSRVTMVAYAPLMAHQDLMTWMTTLLTFNDTRHWLPSPSFTVQQIFREHWRGTCAWVDVVAGDRHETPAAGVEASATCGGKNCQLLSIKVINFGAEPSQVKLTVKAPPHHLMLMGRKNAKSMPAFVEAQVLQFNPENMLPKQNAWDTQTVEDDADATLAALLAEDELESNGNALDANSGMANALKSSVKLSLSGKPISMQLPAYSLTVISAKLH